MTVTSLCALALRRTDGSASKNEITLAKTRQAMLLMVFGESWIDRQNPKVRKADRAGLPVFDTSM
jgi:hypothetical protein